MKHGDEDAKRPLTSMDVASGQPLAAGDGMRFIVKPGADGEPTLDVVDGALEQTYRLGDDAYTTKLFVELCRSHGLLPYRHRWHRSGTISVRASLAEHEALWTRFLALSRELEGKLYALTCSFIHTALTRNTTQR